LAQGRGWVGDTDHYRAPLGLGRRGGERGGNTKRVWAHNSAKKKRDSLAVTTYNGGIKGAVFGGGVRPQLSGGDPPGGK